MDVERAAKACNAILSLVRLPIGVVLPIEIEHQLVEMTDRGGTLAEVVRWLFWQFT